jgi:hypothetical protein
MMRRAGGVLLGFFQMIGNDYFHQTHIEILRFTEFSIDFRHKCLIDIGPINQT